MLSGLLIAPIALKGKSWVEILDSIDLYRIATWIAEEHSTALPRLSFEAGYWRSFKGDARSLESSGKFLPRFERQNDTEMRIITVWSATRPVRVSSQGFAQMQRDLVAEKVEIDPRVSAAHLLASENFTIEAASVIKISYVIGDMRC